MRKDDIENKMITKDTICYLTCLVMKTFEKLVRNELMIKCQQKINQKQHGFLPGKSCTTQMIPPEPPVDP